MHKLIINFTPTGMVPTPQMTPHVPITPRQIVDDVLACAQLGASIVHLHARDDDGAPTYRKDVYARIIEGIRAVNKDLIVCVSTSGRVHREFGQRAEVLDLDGACKPDMASLTLGSMNFSRSASMNDPAMIQALVQRMNQRGIKPELEAFDLGMINYAGYLIRKQMLRPPYYFNVLLGNVATAQGDLLTVGQMIAALPQPCVWALAGIGDWQRRITSLAIAAGGHARIGLEDNIYLDESRMTLATNRLLVQRAADTAAAVGVPLATPAEARQMLGLNHD